MPGLIHDQPISGYDLRDTFVTTAWDSFSDSKGTFYQVVRRLAAQGLARGSFAESTNLRKRRVFRITPKGTSALRLGS